MFSYSVCMASLGRIHTFGPYRTMRKAHEVFDIVTKVAPSDATVNIICEEDKNAEVCQSV